MWSGAGLFDQDDGGLVEMIENLGIEDDVSTKTKMQKIKIIRTKIESKMEGDETAAHHASNNYSHTWKDRSPLSKKLRNTGLKPAAPEVKSEQADAGRNRSKNRKSGTWGRGCSGPVSENKDFSASQGITNFQDRSANQDRQKN